MLPRNHRLARESLTILFRDGRRVFGDHFSLIVIKSSRETSSQWAFVTSKKVFRNATDRNRGKRLMRESIRALLPNIAPGTKAIMLFSRKPGEPFKFMSAQHEIESLLHKAHLLNSSAPSQMTHSSLSTPHVLERRASSPNKHNVF
ncbi:MAG: ribonuclease P protein component [Candidatus Moraniibacteriota bacterium]|nr:MAG: ribonuclease P protein component [Candidatus Moranbacteria bacterium]